MWFINHADEVLIPWHRQLTKSLLKRDFNIEIELPDDRLCPPVRFRPIPFTTHAQGADRRFLIGKLLFINATKCPSIRYVSGLQPSFFSRHYRSPINDYPLSLSQIVILRAL